jgi:hypothetical protein
MGNLLTLSQPGAKSVEFGCIVGAFRSSRPSIQTSDLGKM